MANLTGMKAYQQKAKSDGYSQIPSAGSPSYSEAWALVEAARRMAVAIENYLRQEDTLTPKAREILREPLRLNWRLWTIFQAELINSLDDENSPMLPEIRTNMLTLCQFVDKHTTQALADPTPDNLAVLIDINRNIASGLLENPEAEQTSTQTDHNAMKAFNKSDGTQATETPEPAPPTSISEEV